MEELHKMVRASCLVIKATMGCEVNGVSITDLYDERENTTGSDVTEHGDIWDARGYWLDADAKLDFINWIETQE